MFTKPSIKRTKSLFLRNVLVFRYYLLVILVVMLFALITGGSMGYFIFRLPALFFIVFNVIYTFQISYNDRSSDWAEYIKALPVRPIEIINERYMGGGIVFLIMILLSLFDYLASMNADETFLVPGATAMIFAAVILGGFYPASIRFEFLSVRFVALFFSLCLGFGGIIMLILKFIFTEFSYGSWVLFSSLASIIIFLISYALSRVIGRLD